MKTYHSYTVKSTSEAIIGLMSAYPFESFEEQEDQIICYIPEDDCDDATVKEIEDSLSAFGAEYTVEIIKPQNWNAIWEANFDPVVVDDFCIVRADFHDPIQNITHDIIINPKMAFGTGHHETTYMMMSAMKDMDIANKRIFDYGCGTGVLSILASKLGSSDIDAIDIEEESYQNTIENAEINAVSNINTACTDLPNFPPKNYDIILANINRKVLLDSADELKNRMTPDATLLISGILEEDEKLVTERYLGAGFKIDQVYSRGYWKCIKLT